MIEVAPNLFVGNALDWENAVKGKIGWRTVQCAKEPYHRQALGYKGMGAPRDHVEYLFAYRDDRLILNMVDVDNPAYYRADMIAEAVKFIDAALALPDMKVLIHCNQGGSRAPGLALHYLRHATDAFTGQMPFEDAEVAFRLIYPPYQPAAGIRGFVEQHWDDAPDAVAA